VFCWSDKSGLTQTLIADDEMCEDKKNVVLHQPLVDALAQMYPLYDVTDPYVSLILCHPSQQGHIRRHATDETGQANEMAGLGDHAQVSIATGGSRG